MHVLRGEGAGRTGPTLPGLDDPPRTSPDRGEKLAFVDEGLVVEGACLLDITAGQVHVVRVVVDDHQPGATASSTLATPRPSGVRGRDAYAAVTRSYCFPPKGIWRIRVGPEALHLHAPLPCRRTDSLQRERGDVAGRHLPPLLGQPEGVAPFARSHVESGPRCQPLDLGDEGAVGVAFRLEPATTRPQQRVHPGHDWFFVLERRIQLFLGERTVIVETGEAAEFETMTPHSFAAVGGPAEVIMIFDQGGHRVHRDD